LYIKRCNDSSAQQAYAASVTFAIVARGLTRIFSAKSGVKEAVAGVDLAVEEGEIFGLLGPNGAGKTTTVKMLTTLLRPTGGTAAVAGFDVVRESARVRAACGAVLQETALDPLMTGAEMMALQGALQGLPRKVVRARTAELLGRFGLEAVAGDRVAKYSGGMRRRLDLALSLIHRPSVLFLDEPTVGIDPANRIAVWDEVKALRAEGTTVLLTTQYLEEADRLCQRVAIVAGGKVVLDGPVAELKDSIDVPILYVAVAPDAAPKAEAVLARFGTARPVGDGMDDGMLAIGLSGGHSRVAGVGRALDGAGIAITHLRLESPTLDDVFTAATQPSASSA
jgi:ABC-2 type transport system ATP-binding protein